jgi:hypothetical protein
MVAQVFNDVTEYGQFPALTNGCEVTFLCEVFTPFRVVGSGRVDGSVSSVTNSLGVSDEITFLSANHDSDTTQFALSVYAVWSKPVEASAPGTAMVLLMGIAGLIVSQRRKQA